MLVRFLLTGPLSALALSAALAAEPASLSGDELRKAVSGKTVYLRISGFDLPIRYSQGGSMAAIIGAVAATSHTRRKLIRSWQMVVSGSQLCQRWLSSMEGKTYCYKFTRRGNSLTWVRNDGRSGSARIG